MIHDRLDDEISDSRVTRPEWFECDYYPKTFSKQNPMPSREESSPNSPHVALRRTGMATAYSRMASTEAFTVDACFNIATSEDKHLECASHDRLSSDEARPSDAGHQDATLWKSVEQAHPTQNGLRVSPNFLTVLQDRGAG